MSERDRGNRTRSRGSEFCVRVVNISSRANRRDLDDMFGRHGHIVDQQFDSRRNEAHIFFSVEEEAKRALTEDGTKLRGQVLQVEMVSAEQARRDRGRSRSRSRDRSRSEWKEGSRDAPRERDRGTKEEKQGTGSMPDDSVLEVVIIAGEPPLQGYARTIERRVHSHGLMTLIDILPPDAAFPQAVEFWKAKGAMFIINLERQHELHYSLTLNIMSGTPQEHRNMPVEDALSLIRKTSERTFSDQYMSVALPSREVRSLSLLATPRAIAYLLMLLADNRYLSVEELTQVVTYLDDRRRKQADIEGKIVTPMKEENQQELYAQRAELQAKIMSILSTTSGASSQPGTQAPPAVAGSGSQAQPMPGAPGAVPPKGAASAFPAYGDSYSAPAASNGYGATPQQQTSPSGGSYGKPQAPGQYGGQPAAGGYGKPAAPTYGSPGAASGAPGYGGKPTQPQSGYGQGGGSYGGPTPSAGSYSGQQQTASPVPSGYGSQPATNYGSGTSYPAQQSASGGYGAPQGSAPSGYGGAAGSAPSSYGGSSGAAPPSGYGNAPASGGYGNPPAAGGYNNPPAAGGYGSAQGGGPQYGTSGSGSSDIMRNINVNAPDLQKALAGLSSMMTNKPAATPQARPGAPPQQPPQQGGYTGYGGGGQYGGGRY